MTNYKHMAEKMYSAYCQQAGGLTFDELEQHRAAIAEAKENK